MAWSTPETWTDEKAINTTRLQAISDDLNFLNDTLGSSPEGGYADVATRLDTLSSFKNRLINGNFIVDQYSSGPFSGTLAAATETYVIDRWYAEATGGTPAAAQVAGSGGRKYHFQFTGAASVSEIVFGQRIEAANIQDQASSTVTISVYLANSVLTTVNWAVTYADSEDDFSSVTAIDSGSWTVDSTMTRYTAEVDLPANAANGIQLELSVGAQTSGTWTIGNVQLEPGDAVTDFEFRLEWTEKALCLRKAFLVASGANEIIGSAFYYTSTAIRIVIPLPVPMKNKPSLTAPSSADYYAFFKSPLDTFDTLAINALSTNNVAYIMGSDNVSGTAGVAGQVYANNASAYVFLSDEL